MLLLCFPEEEHPCNSFTNNRSISRNDTILFSLHIISKVTDFYCYVLIHTLWACNLCKHLAVVPSLLSLNYAEHWEF